jgi:hypothetical protein
MCAMSDRADYEQELKRKNYARAAVLAEEGGLGQEEVDKSRELALKQAIGDYFNFRGARDMAQEWSITAERVRQLCDEIIQAFNERELKEGRKIQVFDIERMDHTHVVALIGHFRDGL